MRFHVALDSLEKENRFLRIALVALLVLAVFLCFGILRASQKNPLLVERGCRTRTLTPANSQTNNEEIAEFIQQALPARFNSGARDQAFLSTDQFLARSKEQSELLRQNLRQAVLVNRVTVSDKDVFVDADRLISVGDIRSAFKFPLRVRIEAVPRTAENPYGLVLVSVVPDESAKKEEKGSR